MMAKVKVAAAIMVTGALGLGAGAAAGDRPVALSVDAAPATAASTASPGAAGDSNAAAITQLMALLQAREDHLRNFAYSLRESVSVIDAQGRESLKEHTDVELRSKEGKVLWHFHSGNDANPQRPASEGTMFWDGKQMRQVVAPTTAQPTPKGLISNDEPDQFRMLVYNHMLGFRVLGDFTFDLKQRKVVYNHSTLTQWLTRMVREKVPLSVGAGPAGQTLLVLKVQTSANIQQTCWFDTHRGHMLVRFEYHAQGGATMQRCDVTESRQVVGMWVPTKVVCVSSSNRWPERTRWVYDVKDFQAGIVKDGELRLEFAEGTEVIDQTTTPWDAFRVTHTGTQTLDLERALHGKPQDTDVTSVSPDTTRK